MATRSFYVFKNTNKENEDQPDYRICTEDDNEDLVDIGAMWKRTSPKGNTYLSGKLSDGYQDNDGFWFMTDTEKKAADKFIRQNDNDQEEGEGDDDIMDYPDEDIAPEDIPF